MERSIKPAAVSKDGKQSLLDHCRNKHWQLLQKFALAEIELARHLGKKTVQTFGAKVNKFVSIDKATRKKIINDRNLVAHGYLSVTEVGSELNITCTVADIDCDKNGVTRDRREVDKWCREADQRLSDFLQEAKQTNIA